MSFFCFFLLFQLVSQQDGLNGVGEITEQFVQEVNDGIPQ